MLDRAELAAAVAARGRVARVVVAAAEGSAPREAGAAMLVWEGGQSGTIGGGALEWQAAAQARALLAAGGSAGGAGSAARVDRLPLGPALGQCCGGAVTLVTEVFDAAAVAALGGPLYARSPEGRAMPLAVARMIDRARAQGAVPAVAWVQGWLVEPLAAPARALWVWGAGHVGRAIVAVMAPLPGLALRWLDVAPDRFPADPPAGVALAHGPDPAPLVAAAPREAAHLVATFSHALDLEICHLLLGHGFADAGLIGSASKRARFASRLAALGHAPAAIARIRCPIGEPALGKHPQAIAVGVAREWLAGAGAAAAAAARGVAR